MYNQMQRASTLQSDKIDGAISRGMRWMEQATYNAASQMLPKMGADKQATIWKAISSDPFALQSYVTRLGQRQGITDPTELDRLAGEYITAQAGRFGG